MVINIRIMPKPRMTRRDKWLNPPRLCIKKYWTFKNELVAQCKENDFVLGNRVYMEFHLPMPISWSKKKKIEMLGEPHFSKPDLDNMIKSVADCLKKDDQTIHEIIAKKFWGNEGHEGTLVLKNL